MRNKLLSLPVSKKRLIILGFDTFILWGALFLAFALRVGVYETFNQYEKAVASLVLLIPVVALPVYIRLGFYRTVVRHMGQQVSFIILRASSISTLLVIAGIYLFRIEHVPRSVPVLFWLFSALLLGLSRYAIRYWFAGYSIKDIVWATIYPAQKANRNQHKGVSVAIYGAGEAGIQLASALNRSHEYHPVAFIDDNKTLAGRVVAGRTIYPPSRIDEMITATQAEEILLALPSVKKKRRTEIVQELEELGLPIKTMPGMRDIASGRFKLQDIKEVDIDDVLGREEVKPIPELIEKDIVNKVVMITGAGGSIGSEMVRQALARQPKILVLFEHAEFNLYTITQELQKNLKARGKTTEIISVLGSINDPARMLDIMQTYKVETLYHAAAYKHVPIVQYNMSQGLRNNVLGTLYTAQAAIAAGVKNFVLISTDKAVRPTNVMGASKRLAEMVLQALSEEPEVSFYNSELFDLKNGLKVKNTTRFAIVRFGNVLDSSGSVIPLFREQIRTGGPVTVTHSEINRYFMTIPEAAQLVIQAGAIGNDGDVFVLEMGKPVKIVDLAKRMISLSGLTVKNEQNPDGDIEIIFSGLRPGEKLYEELLIGDNVTATEHPRICRASEEMLHWNELKDVLDKIICSLQDHRYKTTTEILLRYVNGYRSNTKVVDWLYQHAEEQPKPEYNEVI